MLPENEISRFPRLFPANGRCSAAAGKNGAGPVMTEGPYVKKMPAGYFHGGGKRLK